MAGMEMGCPEFGIGCIGRCDLSYQIGFGLPFSHDMSCVMIF
jgi:hypothetical protein